MRLIGFIKKQMNMFKIDYDIDSYKLLFVRHHGCFNVLKYGSAFPLFCGKKTMVNGIIIRLKTETFIFKISELYFLPIWILLANANQIIKLLFTYKAQQLRFRHKDPLILLF